VWRQSHWVLVRWRREEGEAAAAPAVERAAQVALLEGAGQVALLGRVAHTALLERAERSEQVTRTALLVFSPPAAQAKTLSTPRVRALARAPIRPPRTNNSILRTESGHRAAGCLLVDPFAELCASNSASALRELISAVVIHPAGKEESRIEVIGRLAQLTGAPVRFPEQDIPPTLVAGAGIEPATYGL
jgi:hypothetical protein